MNTENRKFNVAVIGCGSFARFFVPLFQAHPAVGEVRVCDILPERAQEYRDKFGVGIIPTFEDALRDPTVDAIAIFTQRHLHGPMVIAALNAGKHVYSAVPMGISPEDCGAIIEAAKRNHKIYMMGETCIYYPCAMYCKKEYEKGTFGNFVYGEAQYFHDLSHFSAWFRSDRPASAVPPFFYPTHSTSMLLWATGAHATRVTAFGYQDREPDTPFAKGENPWDNVFSDEFSLMQLSNGGVARVSECRRIGYKSPSSFISGFYGTKASYQFNNAQHLVTVLTEKGVELHDVSAEVNPREMQEHREDTEAFRNQAANHVWQWNSPSPVQDEERKRLPETFEGKPNGHMASHQFLIDDFCTSVRDGRLPRVNAWMAARFTIPGLIAHQSAEQGGVPMDIPDFGDAPDVW